MTEQELTDRVRGVLATVAPETAGMSIALGAPLREVTELDSLDFLNFVIALHRELGVDVPERDYAKLATLGGCVAYLASRLPHTGAAPSAASHAGPGT